MTTQDRLSEIEERDNARHTIMQNDDIPKLVKIARFAEKQFKKMIKHDCTCGADNGSSYDEVICYGHEGLTEIERILNAEGEG